MEGATHYDIAITNLDVTKDIVCIPANVTRTEAVTSFIEYMKANPQYGAEPPIDGMFRALVAEWPCAK